MENQFSLSEQILLLSVRPEKGGISGWVYRTLDFTLVGAVLLDLCLNGLVRISDKRVAVIKEQRVEEPLLHVMEKLAKSGRPRRISTWMSAWSISKSHIKRELYASLAKKRAIRLEERHFLFFRWKKAYIVPGGAQRVTDQVKKIVYDGPASASDVYLIMLVEVCGLMRRIYPDRFQRSRAKEKIRQIREGSQLQENVREAAETARAIRQAVNASAAAATAAYS